MENRRSFIKKAGILAGSFGIFSHLPKSIEAALAIDPIEGSTFLDAEHIVLLMQENRSFDHSFGTLRGVRGFNDRRAITLTNGNPVWLQSNKQGHTFAPFRMDIKNSKASWSGDLPHSWENQIGAWNEGKFDKWLDWKQSGRKEYKYLPLTLGYYTREDIPFYYAFADAFTICDQHFCSSITGTTTNRHYFWTGKCTESADLKPLVRNSDTYYNNMASWKTFPERLQESGINWKVYQNEISLQNEVSGNDEGLLGNFTDNNLEWFEQYNVRFKKSHIEFYQRRIKELPAEIEALEKELAADPNAQKVKNTLTQKQNQLESFKREAEQYSAENYAKLSDFEKELHERAFQTNEGEPFYHETEEIEFEGTTIRVPKGDVLHQFRQDVEQGKLPTVSWLVAPQHFSDHPSAPMYGAWYVSEILNILTKNPEVWKKTIFILNYDENDGYFDHIPPFVAPKPSDITSGMVSEDLKSDLLTEYVTKEQELASGVSESNATEGPVGLGYRVPLIVASPWTRGGWVNSEVCDITSTIQFLEVFLNKKYNKNVLESNISKWRRAITGDLTSVFRTYNSQEKMNLPDFLDMKRQISEINSAKNKPLPDGYKEFTPAEVEKIKAGEKLPQLPFQEQGTKPSNALHYELYVHESQQQGQVELTFEASDKLFGTKALACAFNVYDLSGMNRFSKSFAVKAGDKINHLWRKAEKGTYNLAVHGPNGFYRKYQSTHDKTHIKVTVSYSAKSNLILQLENTGRGTQNIDCYNAYTGKKLTVSLKSKKSMTLEVDTQEYGRWYDFTLKADGWERQYAGRIENGQPSISDPLMA
ncbi:phosphocholine-specific phospholipase C [Sphingobacterium litopenaei]|uniref:phospholipase C n=1 Tax=Sphingobacterium litopenaei TaxID=2763500 RepID=A0ABR7Y9I8_9SPHI|nr:phospholipase C, phosphocholine-specific [Sphingobacterium litopenaei]MBD1427961.1 phospholipase C, phosphocholine-specific [Sphingobacterium litopenaei]